MTQIALLASVSAVAWLALAQGTDPRREVQDYLTKHRFTADEMAGLEAGDVIARATTAEQEIVVIAAVKIRVPRDRVLDYYGQMISYVDGSVTLGFGRFSTPPAPGDVKDLSFDRVSARIASRRPRRLLLGEGEPRPQARSQHRPRRDLSAAVAADRAFVAQKQIYASHYYDGSLAIATALSATENGAPVTYLVYANRSRGDMLRGGFGGLKRNVAQSQARKAAQETLAINRRLEQ